MSIRYHLTVEQVTENRTYAEELKAYNDKRRYEGMPSYATKDMPQPHITLRVLSVTLSDVEFAAIKKAALAVMA